MRTHRGARILILTLVLVLLTGASLLAIINLIALQESSEKTKADANIAVRAATWNFHNGPVTNKNNEYAHDFGVYEQDYNVFEIGSLQAFENFETSMGEGGRVGRCEFSGKTIKLTANIDCGGKTFNFGWEDASTSNVGLSFHGTFDGQGYTISNMHASPGMWDMGHRYGMFKAMSGTLKNTTFRNFEYYCAGGDDNTGHYGIVAGLNSGTIENCIVDNCKFTSDRFKSNCRVAPIAGQNTGTIKNCIVKGTYTIGGNDGNGLLNDDGLYAHYFVTTGNEAKYCVFDATVIKTGITSELYAPASHDTALSSGNYNYNSFTSAYTNFPSSVASNISGKDGTPWYKYSKKVDGSYRGHGGSSSVPVYLRAFITWKTYNFEVANINGIVPGTVSTSSLIVPSFYSSVGTIGNTKTVYGVTITATAYSDYEFVNWSWSESAIEGKVVTTHIANFKIKDFDLSFEDDDSSEYGNSGMGKIVYRYGSNSYTTETKVSFKVAQGSSVQIDFLTTHSMCNNPTSGTKYAVVKITFTGKRIINGTPEATSRSYEVLFVLTSSDYYISSSQVTKSATNTYATNQTITIDKETSIAVRYAIRDYGLGII